MKNLILLASILLLASGLHAQDDDFETIGANRRSDRVKVSGFAGPSMSFTTIDGEFAHMMGGGAAVIINDFFIGGYGMGKTTELEYKNSSSEIMTFGHGGFWLGYTFMRKKAFHPSFSTQLGWGGIGKRGGDYTNNPETTSLDQVFVICPTLELEMNFSRFFKFGIGANYNLVYNTGQVNSPYTFSDFANPGIFMSLKFGWFK